MKAEQLGPALKLKHDLATVTAGMNDLIRPGFDGARIVADVEEMFARLTTSGVQVATLTVPDIGKIAPIARRLLPRVLDLNARIQAAADRHGVVVLDSFPHAITTDPRMWSPDRLHASPLGHARIASGMAHALGVPNHDDWADPLSPLAPPSMLRTAAAEARTPCPRLPRRPCCAPPPRKPAGSRASWGHGHGAVSGAARQATAAWQSDRIWDL